MGELDERCSSRTVAIATQVSSTFHGPLTFLMYARMMKRNQTEIRQKVVTTTIIPALSVSFMRNGAGLTIAVLAGGRGTSSSMTAVVDFF